MHNQGVHWRHAEIPGLVTGTTGHTKRDVFIQLRNVIRKRFCPAKENSQIQPHALVAASEVESLTKSFMTPQLRNYPTYY